MAGGNNHGSYLANLLGDAKKGFERDKAKDQHGLMTQPGASLTTEQLAHAQNILGMIGNNTKSQEVTNNRGTDHYHSPEIVIDINGHRHDPDDGPVYYKNKTTTTDRLAGVPYAVSDTISRCNKCTRFRDCDRHRRPQETKTDISLCKSNHLRLVLYWNVSDPENRKKSWSLCIEEKYDRFFNPQREKAEHETSERKGKDGNEEDEGEFEGCHPQDPSSRIKELAKRIIEDHNRNQKDKARGAYLDPKGREYTTKPRHWGSKDPFVPAEAADARVGYEWQSAADEGRIKRELRVMLQMWYRSKLSREERGTDRTSEKAKEEWKKKMARMAGERRDEVEFNEHGERIGEEGVTVRGEVQVVPSERFKMSTKEERDAADKERAMAEMEKKREMDRNSLSKVTIVTRKVRKPTTAETPAHKPAHDDSDKAGNTKALKKPTSMSMTKPSRVETHSEELTDERLAGFEQWAKEVDADAHKPNNPVHKTSNSKPQPAPQKRASVVTTTARERKLFAAMKEKVAEEVESEPEPEPEPEEEDDEEEDKTSEESSAEEPPAKPQKAEAKPKITEPASKKPNSPYPALSPKPPALKPQPAEPKPKSKAKPPASSPAPKAPTKRKATVSAAAEKPAVKKSRYKSPAEIIDSDEEADYELPLAPSPKISQSQQRRGWMCTDIVVGDGGVKVVQTDAMDGGKVVVERGTTIVMEVESEGSGAKDGVSSPLSEEAESSGSMGSLFGGKDEGGLGEDNDEQDERGEAHESASDDEELASRDSQHGEVTEMEVENPTITRVNSLDTDECELSEPPSSNHELGDEGQPASIIPPKDPNQDVAQEASAVAGIDGLDSDSSRLSDPPSSSASAEVETRPTPPPQHVQTDDQPTVTNIDMSDSDTSSLSDQPSSTLSIDKEFSIPSSTLAKRKAPFDDDEYDQDEAKLAKKAKKSVRFDEEVYYENTRNRRMSIEYVLDDNEVEDGEGEGQRSEEAGSDGEEGEVSEEEDAV